MAQKDRSTLQGDIVSNLPDNADQLITEAVLRTLLTDFTDSMTILLSDGSVLGLKNYDTGVNYVAGDTAVFSGVIYQANKATTGAFIPADWDVIPIGGNIASLPAWDNALTYNIGDVVREGSSAYESLVGSNNGNQPSLSPTEWADISSSFEDFMKILDWSGAATYEQNDTIIYNTQWYRSLVSSNTGNQPDTSPSEWEDVTPVIALPNGQIFVGNPSNVPTATATNTAFNKNFGTGAGDVVEGNDSRLNFGQHYAYAESLALSSTTSILNQLKVQLSIPAHTAGTYEIVASYNWRRSETNNDFAASLTQNNGAVTLRQHRQEASDSGADQGHVTTMIVHVVSTGAAQTYEIYYSSPNGVGTSFIRDARITFKRVL